MDSDRADRRTATVALLHTPVAPEDLLRLVLRTDGWAAGLWLGAVSLRGAVDVSGFISAFVAPTASSESTRPAKSPSAREQWWLRDRHADLVADDRDPGRPAVDALDGRAPAISGADVDRMVSKLFLTDRTQRSAFWALLVLAAIIAAAGVVGDSTATVIGAMIVAPLMTPILGTALAVVLADRRKVVANVALVLAGAAVVVAIGYVLGLLVPEPVLADTNSQVASRVSPKLIDLVAALATGVVGAFAQVRSDVSDTLPGVAIAISLVPPLSVVGLTLESGDAGQAAGALLLFGTNVAAIIATGTAVLLGYRLRGAAVLAGRPVGRFRPRTAVVLGAFVVAVAVPLSAGSYRVIRDQQILLTARPVAERWAQSHSVQLAGVTLRQGVMQVAAVGRTSDADPRSLRQGLDDAGLADVGVRLSLVDGTSNDLPAPTPQR